jgi:hypothetical protein
LISSDLTTIGDYWWVMTGLLDSSKSALKVSEVNANASAASLQVSSTRLTH